MLLRASKKTIVVLSLLTSTFSYASLDTNKVPCPPSHIIQQSASKIDSAYKFDEGYIAGSSKFIFTNKNLQWQIVTFLNAKSSKQAIELSRNAAQKITFSKQKYADNTETNQYNCDYGPTQSVHVGAVAYK